ncbi:hypothetical protein MUK42_11003 [Musa troglodytarum]|uniref:HMA domain-containing protein n=1 Tax=Musa troglodytarum TaxID=320322 RepID=A0A9E7GL05_9LILI|nr:hypothetical protein MUK42_11003 [Musa troglodytarum]
MDNSLHSVQLSVELLASSTPFPFPCPITEMFDMLLFFLTSTVAIKVDLECRHRFKKMEKALCKLQKQFSIPSIVYDKEKNTVTVSGPFNPECFVEKLRCLACKVIIDIQIIPVIVPVAAPPTNTQQTTTTTKTEVAMSLIMCAYPPPGWPAGCDQPCSCYRPWQWRQCCRCCSCNKPPRSGAEGCMLFEFCKIEVEESSPACSMM